MPRKLLINSSEFPYHITNRSNNKDYFSLPSDVLWEIFLSIFTVLKEEYKCELLQFVLMSNHYHLLLYTPNENLSEAMLYLHREVAKISNKKSRRINHFFGGRYKWCLINSDLYFWNTVKYIFRNPVEAQMCSHLQDYQFSSLNRSQTSFHLNDFFFDRSKPVGLDLDWLNHSFSCQESDAIRSGLKKKIFKMHKIKHKKLFCLSEMPRQNDYSHPPKVLGTF